MFQEEFEVTLRQDMAVWAGRKITGDELSEMLKERRKKAEEATDAMIKSMMADLKIEGGQNMPQAQETNKQHQDTKKETTPTIPSPKGGAKDNGKISRTQTVTPGQRAKCSAQNKPSMKASQMSEELKRSMERKERLEKQIRHFAVADARDVRRVAEKEVKELGERALAMDSLICKQVLGLAWERPPVELMEPVQPEKQRLSLSGQTSECSQSTNMDGAAVQTEVQEVTLSMETVMELWCDKKPWDDPAEDKTYWDRMANIICEDQLRLWDDTEKALKRLILTDTSELNTDNDRLQKENTDLRRQLEAAKDKSQQRARDAGTHPQL